MHRQQRRGQQQPGRAVRVAAALARRARRLRVRFASPRPASRAACAVSNLRGAARPRLVRAARASGAEGPRRAPAARPASLASVRMPADACLHRAATATNGVVVATEKKVSSPLVDDTMVKKIAEIDKHVGMVYSGVAERAVHVSVVYGALHATVVYGALHATALALHLLFTTLQCAPRRLSTGACLC